MSLQANPGTTLRPIGTRWWQHSLASEALSNGPHDLLWEVAGHVDIAKDTAERIMAVGKRPCTCLPCPRCSGTGRLVYNEHERS